MGKREAFLYTIFIAVLAVLTVNVVLQALTGQGLRRFVPELELPSRSEAVVSRLGSCQDSEPRIGLAQAQDVHLRQLERYQVACHSFAVDRTMIFTDMPKDDLEARDKAVAMSVTLKEFASAGITPIVIVEPTSNWGLIDFEEFDTGFYDRWISTYFQTLKQQGITDDSMGIWVPFPEANLPLWNNQNTTPEHFAIVVNRYLRLLKANFPNAHASILLNSATYESSDFNWQSGEYISLLPYVERIDKRLVTSVGIQGFPWLPPQTQPGPGVVDTAQYLNVRLLGEAATSLDVDEVWINTGTFRSKYTIDTDQTVRVAASKREDLLNRTVTEALKLHDQGFTVWVNIFAEDKSNAAEATDWSYLPGEGRGDDSIVLTNFIRRATDRGIGVSLFDRAAE